MPSNDIAFAAQFITAAEDAAGISAEVDGVALDGGSPLATNITVGVYLEWPVDFTALSEPKIAVAGRPAGLKFAAKDIVDSKTKAVIVPANTIYGTPTAVSKPCCDSTGAVNPSILPCHGFPG